MVLQHGSWWGVHLPLTLSSLGEGPGLTFLWPIPSLGWGGQVMGGAMAREGMSARYTICSEDKQMSLGILLGDRWPWLPLPTLGIASFR